MAAHKVFEVEIEIVKLVHVRFAIDIIPALVGIAGTTIEEVAEEFALAGKSAWPQYIVREDEEYDVIAVRELPQPADDTEPDLPLSGGAP